jgi:hypothetical protein
MAPAYRLGKGPIVIALEEFLKRDRAVVEEWYDQLVDEKTYLDELEPTVFDKYVEANDPGSYEHLMDEVFGAGDAQGISRRQVYGKGFRRALETAFGFGGKAIDPPWEIDAYWGCGQPYNLVALRTNPERGIVTAIIYSDEVATGDDRRNVVPSVKGLTPDEEGQILIVDDLDGTVKEWRATRDIGLATSPPTPAA